MKYILLLSLAGISCRMGENSPPPQIAGFAPVYSVNQLINAIGAEAPRPTVSPGKIYAYGSYLFQVEQNEGIHIISNTDPHQVQKISFLKIPLCTEISIRAGYLYTNNLNDLVVFDLTDPQSPILVTRLNNAFPAIDQNHPPFTNCYFECPDPSKGIVIAWEQKILNQPKCRR